MTTPLFASLAASMRPSLKCLIDNTSSTITKAQHHNIMDTQFAEDRTARFERKQGMAPQKVEEEIIRFEPEEEAVRSHRVFSLVAMPS